MDRRTRGSYQRSVPPLKHIVFGIACTFALFWLSGSYLFDLASRAKGGNISDDLRLPIGLLQPIGQLIIGFWIGSRVARFAWLVAPIPALTMVGASAACSGLGVGRDLDAFWILYLSLIIPSLVGGLAGHFWRLSCDRKAVVGLDN